MRGIPKGDQIAQHFIVAEPAELLNFLIEKEIKKSKNSIQSVLKRRMITVNGKLVTQYNFALKKGDKVAVMKVDQTKKIKRLQGMSIVYEDESIIIIDKSAGLLSVATDREKTKTVFAVLSEYVKKKNRNAQIYILHRLDREASGLMIFAKDLSSQGKFQRDWNSNVLEYKLSVVVEGVMPNESGTMRTWLTQNRNYQVFSATYDNGGEEAVSHYKVKDSNGRYSLLDINMETRHRNQIRAQLEQMQRPIVGDKKYGAKSSPIKRSAMHVGLMRIKHPLTGRIITFESPLPKVIKGLLSKNLDNIVDE